MTSSRRNSFEGRTAEEQAAAAADEWRVTLLAKGFTDVAI